MALNLLEKTLLVSAVIASAPVCKLLSSVKKVVLDETFRATAESWR